MSRWIYRDGVLVSRGQMQIWVQRIQIWMWPPEVRKFYEIEFFETITQDIFFCEVKRNSGASASCNGSSEVCGEPSGLQFSWLLGRLFEVTFAQNILPDHWVAATQRHSRCARWFHISVRISWCSVRISIAQKWPFAHSLFSTDIATPQTYIF